MHLRLNRFVALVAAALFATMVVVPAAHATAGKVLLVVGSVVAEGTNARELKAGDVLNPGDIVVTGERSRAQLLMADGARVALRSGSTFRIDALSLPTIVRRPTLKAGDAASGKSLFTLLKGGFSTSSGAIGAGDSSPSELLTPIGTLSPAGANYTAVFCRGDCAEAPGFVEGQSVPDGLYLVVDEGAIVFNARGVSLSLAAPCVEFIPLEAGESQQLAEAPAFLRNDGAGALQLAGRPARVVASNSQAAQPEDRRSPGESALAKAVATEARGSKELVGQKPERNILAISPLGRAVDLLIPKVASESYGSLAIAVPASSGTPYLASATTPSQMQEFSRAGSLLQFDALWGSGGSATYATYLSGTASLMDFGGNGSSGIRWGRWTSGSASINTVNSSSLVALDGTSLHWIAGPSFEVAPILPVSGSTNFVLAGATSPTDTLGHMGIAGSGTLSADFTSQQVSTAFSLDLNGYNWSAAGGGAIKAGTVLFEGSLSDVLVDGRIKGTGAFKGFLSTGALAPDQLTGAGISYWLAESSQQLGTVSGVLAFVPGPRQTITPPAVQRDIAYAVGVLDKTSGAGGAATNTLAQLSRNANGDITGFSAPVPHSLSGTLAIGISSVLDTGSDVATGISWGRWEGSAVDVTTPPGSVASSDLNNQALHWIVGNEFGTAPVIPKTGTAIYSLVGNTSPTDTRDSFGTMGDASFTANFTNRTVNTALTLNVAGADWYASGSGSYAADDPHFSGAFDDVRIQNLVRGQGSLHGFFTMPRVNSGTMAGAAYSFNLADSTGDLGTVSGVLAFAQDGQGTVVIPPAFQDRDIALVSPDFATDGTSVKRASYAEYAVDSGFNLTSLPGLTNTSPADTARYGIGTSTIAESDVSPIVMLRWGRWAGGDANVTNVISGSGYTLSLAQQSLHWIEGGDSAVPPVMPQTGTFTYSLIGGTTPTDRAGHLGTLDEVSLTANFTSQVVSALFDVSINNLRILATGDGAIGAPGLAAHQFSGSINGGVVSPTLSTPTGSFSGFFTAPGSNVAGVPGGVGLTYSIGDGQGVIVDGAAALKGP